VVIARAQPVVLPILRTAHPGVTIHSRLDPEALSKLPYVHVRFGEKAILHPRLRLAVPLTLYSLVDGDDAEADNLASALYQTLYDAVRLQTTVPAGHLTGLETRAWPRESPIPGQPSGVIRYEAVYLVGIRPASVTP
jgi:hypothetical protein